MSDPVAPSPSAPATPQPRRPYWLPVPWILGLAAIIVLVLRQIHHISEQHFIMNVGRVVIGTLAALLIWLLGPSRLRWRTRGLVLVAFIALIGLGGLCFRIRGVSGNLIPLIEFRWAPDSASLHYSLNPTRATSVTIPGAADFPQFLGPNRDGVLLTPRLATNWSTTTPRLLWRQKLGTAWSGFAVSGALAVTQEQRGQDEMVTGYDLNTGQMVWAHSVSTRYFTTLAGEGPRATPSIGGGRVFAVGATGRLTCLDLAQGQEIWTKDILSENKVGVPSWGHSSSPLLYKDWVIVNAGGHHDRALIAYRSSDGKLAWNGGNEGSTYSSPLPTQIAGVEQILLFGDSLAGHDATTGKVLWQFPWPGGHPHVSTPIRVGGSDVILSSGYGTGAGRVSVKQNAAGQWEATPVWRSNRMKAKFTNLIVHRGFLYGLDDGILACLDVETGILRWKDGKYGHGQVLLVGDLLLLLAESGEIVLVDPNPEGLRELSRFEVLQGKTWNPPAMAGELLVVRNDKEAACYRLPVR